MKTVVYQRTNKAPVYFAMKGMLNVERRFILMLKNADEDLVVVGNRAVTTLDHSKTSYKTLLYEAWAVAVNERDIAFRGEGSRTSNKHTMVPPGLARPTVLWGLERRSSSLSAGSAGTCVVCAEGDAPASRSSVAGLLPVPCSDVFYFALSELPRLAIHWWKMQKSMRM